MKAPAAITRPLAVGKRRRYAAAEVLPLMTDQGTANRERVGRAGHRLPATAMRRLFKLALRGK
jgi:hypothetical protein